MSWFWLSLFLAFINISHGLGVGRVDIRDVTPGLVSTGLISWAGNEAGTSKNIALYAEVRNQAGALVPFETNVNVTCELLISDSGYTGVTFNSQVVPLSLNGNVNITLPYRLDRSGRMVGVSCYGESVNPSNASTPQFQRLTSPRATKDIEVRPPATVSFCEAVTYLDLIPPYNTTVTVKFSEPVVSSNIVVSCSQIGTAAPWISFRSATAAIGTSSVVVGYEVRSRGAARAAQCTARSLAGSQFLTATSGGATSEFRLSSADARIEPSFAVIRGTTITSQLVLGRQVSVALVFTCRLDVTTNATQAHNMATNPTCSAAVATPTPATPGVNVSVTSASPTPAPHSWELTQQTFAFPGPAGEVFGRVVATYTLSVLGGLQDLVVITCCAPDTSPSPPAAFVSAAMLAVVDIPLSQLPPPSAVDPATAEQPTAVPNPAFVPLAPCPCDLSATCDTDCCCDQDCNEQEKGVFSRCIPGPFGGVGSNFMTDEPRSCDYDHAASPRDWHVLLCIVSTRSGLLGNYAQDLSAGDVTFNTFNEKFGSSAPLYSFDGTKNVSRVFEDGGLSTSSSYKRGRRVKIYIPNKATTSVLTLPQYTLNGAVLQTAPLHFQTDSSASRRLRVTPTTCSAHGPLSAASYLSRPSSVTNPTCPDDFYVIGDLATSGNPVKVTANYFCLTGSQLDEYIINQASGVSSATDVHLFRDNCLAGTSLTGGPCPPSAVVTTPLQRCSFDDGQRRPPSAAFDGTANTCSHAVLTSHYTLLWQGNNIVGINATYYVGNVSSSDVVAQRSTAQWQHFKNDTVVPSGVLVYRSGSPGYNESRPVLGAVVQGQAAYTPDISLLQLWKPGGIGLCDEAEKMAVPFGEDVTSTCSVRVAMDQVHTCGRLRQVTLRHLEGMFSAGAVSRVGDPSTAIVDWVNLFKPGQGQALNVRRTPSLVDNAPNICRYVPTGTHLYLLRAETGKREGTPIKEIVGAYALYSYHNWTLACSGGGSGACLNSSLTSTFLLTASVTYIDVPADGVPSYLPAGPERLGVCRGGTCLRELFLPFLDTSGQGDSYQKRLGFGLVYSIFAIAVLGLARPWFTHASMSF